ncbi:MAG: phosphoadenosine phosphosulfate reductase [Pseudoruegeria sp.]
MNKVTELIKEDSIDQDLAKRLQALDDIGEERGHFLPLGPDHSAIFTDDSTTLLVTFESLPELDEQNSDGLPLGFELVEGTDWSQLCILSHTNGWFRDQYIYRYIDRLTDDGFFDDFDKVIFYGAGACGYAAAAYSVAAPGATVICIQPQATLDPEETPWESRFPTSSNSDFTGRYAYAPDMIQAAADAYILFDPSETQDAQHAALFDNSHVSQILCRYMGPDILEACLEIDILKPMILAAADPNFDESNIYHLLRNRRQFPKFRDKLLIEARSRGKIRMTHDAARFAINEYGNTRIARKILRWSQNAENRRTQTLVEQTAS